MQHRAINEPDFFESLLDDLTVRVTGMFRDPEFYRAFRSRVVPVLRTYPILRIWHCGCATGEEVYASAIVLTEEGLYDRTQIYATDLSAQAIDVAKQGVYRADRVESFTKNYESADGTSSFSTYYTQAYDRIAMRESLRKNVLFFQHNLVSDHAFGEMQVVFCRNVLIYFGPDLKDRVMDKIAESLCPGGFLCLGSGERVMRAGNARHWVDFAHTERIYRWQA
jgi:chemotaxis protein methyltransferase CheR